MRVCGPLADSCPMPLADANFSSSDLLIGAPARADFVGVNHYYRSIVKLGWRDATVPAVPAPTDMFINLPCNLLLRGAAVPGFEKNEMGWDLTPSSMDRLLLAVWERYHAPIIVTESGTADGDEPDVRRIRYISALLVAIQRLKRVEGVDIRGYLVWSLLDNYEWAEGFRPKVCTAGCTSPASPASQTRRLSTSLTLQPHRLSPLRLSRAPQFGLLRTDFDTFERHERKATCDMLRSVFAKQKVGNGQAPTHGGGGASQGSPRAKRAASSPKKAR